MPPATRFSISSSHLQKWHDNENHYPSWESMDSCKRNIIPLLTHWTHFNINTILPCIRNPIIKIRQLWDYFIFIIRGVTIRVPHDTIRISIQMSRYNMYLDTYLNTVRCQRDVMSSMKTETPVIRSPAHNLLLQWMEYLLLQLPMLSQDVTLLSYIRVFPSIWSEKKVCVSISLVQEYLCI